MTLFAATALLGVGTVAAGVGTASADTIDDMGRIPGTEGVAPADWGGAVPFDNHSFNVRTGPGTNYAVKETVRPGDFRPCTTAGCDVYKTGSSYTCWPGGPSGKVWLKVVSAKGGSGWVAQYCATWGRVG
nr:hypothetical protein [Streptomyces sp. S1D4-11]QIY93076.1 hypothetical protein HEP87_01120 [Streptomyces sp. S1D4-11]